MRKLSEDDLVKRKVPTEYFLPEYGLTNILADDFYILECFGQSVAARYTDHVIGAYEQSDADFEPIDDSLADDIAHKRESLRQQCWYITPDVEQAYQESLPISLINAFNASGYDSVLEWLAEDSDDAQFMNFMEWNTYSTLDVLTSEEVNEHINQTLTKFVSRVNKAIEDGWFTGEYISGEMMMELSDTVSRAVFSDVLSVDGHVEGATSEIFSADVGIVESEIKLVVPIAGSSDERKDKFIERLDAVLTHELLHLLFNHIKRDEDHDIFDSPVPRWVDEGLTEYIAMSLINGEFEDLSEFRRTSYDYDVNDVYRNERHMLGLLMEPPSGTVDYRLLTRYYTGGPKEEIELLEALYDGWGPVDLFSVDRITARDAENDDLQEWMLYS